MKRALAVFLLLSACADETDPLGRGADAASSSPDVTTSAPDASEADAEAHSDAASVEPDASLPDSGTMTSTTGDPSVTVVDLGTVTLANGQSMPTTFTLPEGTVSFMLVIEGPADTAFIPYKLDGPTGNLVSDDGSTLTAIERFLLGPYGAQFKSANRVTQDLGVSGSLFPNNPGVTVSGGEYTLVVGGMKLTGMGVPHNGDVTVKVYVRRQIPAASRLDVHLYFTGAGGITSTSAPTNPLIMGALTSFAAIYAQAGIEVGTVSYHTADAGFQTITGFDGSGDNLERMFQTTAGNGRGLHFFFVDRFMGGFPGATVAGVAGGLPGAPDHVGSVGAGVAVAVTAANGDPGILAHVMAHEGGHWLGLFHTSEITGTLDQHPETPEGMGGQNHLMYPAVGGGTTVSPSQGQVMRLHGETVAR